MNKEDKIEFAKVMNGLSAMYRTDIAPEMLGIWWNSLADWSIEDFKGAAAYLLKNSQYMPRPYDFEQLMKAEQFTPAEAWGKALKHSEGSYTRGPLGDELTDAAVRAIGGYKAIGSTQFEKLGFIERSFKEAYGDIAESSDIKRALPNLTNSKMIEHKQSGGKSGLKQLKIEMK